METEIRTERLILRPFRETDSDGLFAFLSQLESDKFEPYPGISYENGWEQLRERVGSKDYFAIELIGTGRVIGNIYCADRPFEAKEVGYILNEDSRGAGYAAEALAAVVGNAFSEGAHRVYAECDPRNTPSWRLLERLGFRREAHFRQNVFSRTDEAGVPKWKDTSVYALLRGEKEAER